MTRLQLSVILPSFIVTLCVACISPTYSQFCAADPGQIPKDYKSISEKVSPILKSGGTAEIGISFHIVESVAGDLGVTTAQLEDEIEGLNNIFFDTGLRFFMCGSQRTIQGLNSYDFNSGASLNRTNHVLQTINVYFVNELTTSNLDALCGYAVFPWSGKPENRYAVVEKGCIGGGKVLAHELGHYFGLLHTHDTFSGIEWVNGTNCDVAGDMLCDTPADYNLARGGLSGCTYTGQFVDPNGDFYNPNPSNIMSYAPPSCIRRLTDGQVGVAAAWADQVIGDLIGNCADFPDFLVASSTGTFTIQSGESFEISLQFGSDLVVEDTDVDLYFYLSDDPNQLGQIIQREKISFQAGLTDFQIDAELNFPLTRGSGTYILTAVLDADLDFIEQSKSNNQVSITLNVDNSALDDVTLFPNPATDHLRFFIRSSNDQGKFTVRFVDLNGRILKEISGFKNEEEFFNEFDISDLPSGLIAVSVQFDLRGDTFPFLVYKL